MTRGFAPLLGLVLLLGVGALAWATEGFRVITSQGARQLSIARHPIPIPNVRLIDQDSHSFSFADYRGETILVDFIYTRCLRLCGVLGDDFRQALPLMDAKKVRIAFLSISFDRADDGNALQLYADRFGATAPRWRIAMASDARGLTTLLQTFGVTVIPDGMGGFMHDGTIYLVDEAGRLACILDPDARIAAVRP
jgi:protein SCO1/2